MHMEHRARILMADDEDTFLRATATLFQRANYHCDCATDADGVLAAVERESYDVLVADINMAGNRNLELLREIRDRFADLPVILVTGYPSLGTAIEALRLGAVDYILKPVDFPELRQRVDDAAERVRILRSIGEHLGQLGGCIDRLQSMRPDLAPTVSKSKHIEASRSDAPTGRPAEATQGAAFDDVSERLSPREREILNAVAAGQRVASIAQTLHISPHTVRNHLKAIFRKVGVHSQVELLGHLHARASSG
jgi:DNA-binding NarL/FixJ family response regulator